MSEVQPECEKCTCEALFLKANISLCLEKVIMKTKYILNVALCQMSNVLFWGHNGPQVPHFEVYAKNIRIWMFLRGWWGDCINEKKESLPECVHICCHREVKSVLKSRLLKFFNTNKMTF